MRISVNLATRPFVELRPFFLRLRWIMVALVLVAIGLIVAAHMEQQKLNAAQATMNALQVRTNAATAEKQSNERRMRAPANAAMLDRAHFLNALFLRKSFSWTAVMMDLETVLPSGVQITSIEPQPNSEGDVIIRMRVAGDRDRAVQLVRNLEHSKRFLQPRLSSEAVQAKDLAQQKTAAASGMPAGVEFEILANYNPLPEGQAYPKIKVLSEQKHASSSVAPPLAKSQVPAGRPGVVLKPMPPITPQQARPSPQIPIPVTPPQPKPQNAPPKIGRTA
jgi:type IV pilus assembly protein PilN